jgi:hypothetical protein
VANDLCEFQRLCDQRELALLNLLGVVQHAVGNLNLNDPPAALRTLMGGLEFYDRVDRAITEFRKQLDSEKENNNGNRSANATATAA